MQKFDDVILIKNMVKYVYINYIKSIQYLSYLFHKNLITIYPLKNIDVDFIMIYTLGQ